MLEKACRERSFCETCQRPPSLSFCLDSQVRALEAAQAAKRADEAKAAEKAKAAAEAKAKAVAEAAEAGQVRGLR